MKIKCFGSRFFGSQIQRIEEGFVLLGHEISDENPNLIYCNDPAHFKQAIDFADCDKSAKLILNILDCPAHIEDFQTWISTTKSQLARADAITSISKTVVDDVKKYLGFDSFCIYNPIKDITDLSLPKTNPFVYVGRANDPQKRFYLVAQTVNQTNLGPNALITVGSDNPNFGIYGGIISDEELNHLYNVSKYIIFPSSFEGLGLGPLEALQANCIPILTNDNPVFQELYPKELLCSPTVPSIISKIKEHQTGLHKDILSELKDKYKIQFDKKTIANNILQIYNNL